MIGLTERQADVLAWIEVFILRNRQSPTLREICDGMGFSLHAADCHVRAIRSKGRITFEDGKSQTIRVVAEGQ
jgi:SOS-response transcriptional repressor LexA